MANINDVFNQIKNVNTNLQTVQTELTQVNNSINTGLANVSQNLQTIISLDQALVGLNKTMVKLQTYADQALFHISAQNDTIICNLEKISRITCDLLNESHTQTGLQKSMNESLITLVELHRISHPDASCELERLNKLQKQILDCCPKEQPGPYCTYEPCKGPGRLNEPPKTDSDQPR